MSNSADKFEKLEENGAKALEIMRTHAYTPAHKKMLRTWTITEAAELIGRTTETIRFNIKKKKIPAPQVLNTSTKKVYTMNQVNLLRDFFGTRPTQSQCKSGVSMTFANFKGGVAKTTSAVHAAQYFAKKGYKILIIDCDSQASATNAFGYVPDEEIKDEETLYPYLCGKIETLRPIIRNTYWPDLDLIPANLALYNAEFELPVLNAKAKADGIVFNFHDILRNGIHELKKEYDIIILDCPPSMGMISINAIYAADGLIIPVPAEIPDYSSTVQFFGMVKSILRKLPDKNYSFIRLLITKFDGSTNSKNIASVYRQIFGSHVMYNEMSNTTVIKKAGTEMRTIYEIENYKGSTQTLRRAIQLADDVNEELENLVIQVLNEKQQKQTSLQTENTHEQETF